MPPQDTIQIQNCKLQTVAENSSCRIDILRLDELHPVISGNKWFKLREHLQCLQTQCATGLITFGGAYSNHIVACAYAAQQNGLPAVGIIRGEPGKHISPTLQDAERYGMKLMYVSRDSYRSKLSDPGIRQFITDHPGYYLIPEGAADPLGVKGAASIASVVPDLAGYTHIFCAVGTGTMMAGLITAASENQEVVGFSVFKNHGELKEMLLSLLPENYHRSHFSFNCDYAHGGYGKITPELIRFMNEFYQSTGIPTDRVYSGKLLYGAMDLFNKSLSVPGSRILVIHCGGLQGNRSLPSGTLCF